MIILNRIIHTDKYTIGVLEVNNKYFFTLELPYNNNIPFKSSIPAGFYGLKKYKSNKFGDCIKVEMLENYERTDILIHPGNKVSDTKGCILIGKQASVEGVIYNSKEALKEFLNLIEDGETLFVDNY